MYNMPPIDQSERMLSLFQSKGQLVEDLRESLSIGKKCFVTSNSKKTIATLSKMIETDFGDKVRQSQSTSAP